MEGGNGVETDVPHGGEEFKVNADLLGEYIVVQTPDSVGVISGEELGNEMIALFLAMSWCWNNPETVLK